jgi:hypothetical protein
VTTSQSLTVRSVVGYQLPVQHRDEVDWYNTTRDAYTAETRFSERTDLADLDRLLVLELSIYRLSNHLASGYDYDDEEVDGERLRRQLREMSDAVTKLKTAMGLTKSARDAAANDGDFATWLATLQQRARLFGIHREKQLTRALVLMNELAGIVGTYDRADTEERRRIGFETETGIVDWIRTVMVPEYTEIDTHFQHNVQQYWTRD